MTSLAAAQGNIGGLAWTFYGRCAVHAASIVDACSLFWMNFPVVRIIYYRDATLKLRAVTDDSVFYRYDNFIELEALCALRWLANMASSEFVQQNISAVRQVVAVVSETVLAVLKNCLCTRRFKRVLLMCWPSCESVD